MNPFLQKMTESEFLEFRSASSKGYAISILKSGPYTPETAKKMAEESFARLLPEKEMTKNHYFYLIKNEQDTVGHLWIGLVQKDIQKICFIYDIEIYESFRGKGLGRRSMELVDKKAKELEASMIELHVFDYNHKARKLYETSGFSYRGHTMGKPVTT